MSLAGRASSRANAYAEEGPRMAASSRHDRMDDAIPSSPPPQANNFRGSFGHKRTASGNPRPVNRSLEERRYESRKITERTYESQIDRLVPQNLGKQSTQGVPTEGGFKQRSSEWKPKDSRSDVSQCKM